ncbi:MAG: Zn-ribbon domain-containing OB-fold protein [Candidatus Bathyarchaeota archaeon]|nr:Zn-ribbon domain-containing OB-fold protein [Candidatus Bathyarchaeota archaeon]MDW8040290.1 Zn-ribbon domain-containing OB-fold protein [Nitrososphaerota archaeon]
MTEPLTFTIEQFYKNINQKKLTGGKCLTCGKIHLPPRPLCDNCLSTQFKWVELPRKGTLLTYTIIHVAPSQFQKMTPYAVGIIQLEHNVNLPGIIKDTPLDKIKVGMPLEVELEEAPQSQHWPQWPRYYFKPA